MRNSMWKLVPLRGNRVQEQAWRGRRHTLFYTTPHFQGDFLESRGRSNLSRELGGDCSETAQRFLRLSEPFPKIPHAGRRGSVNP